ncbi:hypothetical protein EON65_10620 [archaeon]|nr:MAG: hypothetical protein EON65_10620 [archaeon]
MRKRKTLNVKRVTTRSIGGLPKFLTSVGDSMPTSALVSEGFIMEREEKLQRLVDNFWGLDKDLRDRIHEQEEMSMEDRLSMLCESTQRMIRQQQKWEEEFVVEQKLREENDREDRVQQRLHHLRLINSPVPVEEVLTAIWGLDDHQHTPLLPNIASLSLNSLYCAPNVKKMLEEGQTSEAHGDPSLLSLESVRMPLHLEGLQRSREIIDQARNNIKVALKEIYTSSLNSLDTKPPPLALPESSQKKNAPASQQTEKGMRSFRVDFFLLVAITYMILYSCLFNAIVHIKMLFLLFFIH